MLAIPLSLLLASYPLVALANPCPYAELAKRDAPFQGLSASDQQAAQWNEIIHPNRVGRHQDWPRFSVERLLVESMSPSVITVSNELPKGRVKLVHSAGAVVKAKFMSLPAHPYTYVGKSVKRANLLHTLCNLILIFLQNI